MYSEPFLAVLCSCANSEWFSKICPYFRHLERYYFIFKPKDSYIILIARESTSQDPNILPVKYEDIIATPKVAVRQLFTSLEIDGIHVDHAVASMGRDSQRDSALN